MRVICRRLRRAGADDGFTLIELVISVAILGIVAAALFGVMFQYLKTTSDTSARLNESTDEQFISTYWQNDVSSLNYQSLDASGALITAQSVFVGSPGPKGCGSGSGQSVVVTFAWNKFAIDDGHSGYVPDDAWNPSSVQEVSYVTLQRGNRFVLKRLRCVNGTVTSTTPVAHSLTEANPTVRCGDGVDPSTDTVAKCTSSLRPNRVSMTFIVKDADNTNSAGYTTTVSADRRQG